jgi:hypothetical protein
MNSLKSLLDIKSPEARVFIVIALATVLVNLAYDYTFTGLKKIA